MVLHVLELLGGVPQPFGDLAQDAQRRLRTIGSGRVAGEFPVGEVGIVDERAAGLDDVDAFLAIALRQLGPPDRRFERAEK